MAKSAPKPPLEPLSDEAWDRDTLMADDVWARDDWKNADWGKPPASSRRASPSPPSGGMRSYQQGMMEAGPYLTLGLQIAFGMLLFVGIGYAADRLLNSAPWGMIVGAILGMVAVFALVFRMANEANAKGQPGAKEAEHSLSRRVH